MSRREAFGMPLYGHDRRAQTMPFDGFDHAAWTARHNVQPAADGVRCESLMVAAVDLFDVAQRGSQAVPLFHNQPMEHIARRRRCVPLHLDGAQHGQAAVGQVLDQTTAQRHIQ